ncbi:hypothetical protein OG459_25365 [Streptomyces canus]
MTARCTAASRAVSGAGNSSAIGDGRYFGLCVKETSCPEWSTDQPPTMPYGGTAPAGSKYGSIAYT